MFARALCLLALTLLGCLPTWQLPDWDGTEGRRVQIALEMVRSGDWMVPTLGGEPTWAKPPLHYWLLAACEQWLGGSRVALRLPSVLGAFAAALVAGELLRRWFGVRAGWIGALAVATSPLVLFDWPTAEIDPLFASLTASSILCLATGVARERTGLVVASGLVGGLALLQKGPPYFLFAAGAYIVWLRAGRWRFLVPHFAPMVAVVLAYFGPLWAWRIEPAAMLAVANEESVGRMAYMEWQHVRAIPGFWLRAVLICLPFVLWWRWPRRAAHAPPDPAGDLTLRMCLAAALVAVALLTFFPGRPTRYILPNVLLLAFALAPAVANFTAERAPVPRAARLALVGLGVLGAVALVVVPFVPRAGVGALGLALAAAVAPVLVRDRLHVVAACLLLPVVGSWTVARDRALTWAESPRARLAAGALLRRELDNLRVDPAELRTAGHFDSPLLLAAGILPPGDESGRAPWSSRWMLHERGGGLDVPGGYVARLQLDLPFKSFVLRERTGDAR